MTDDAVSTGSARRRRLTYALVAAAILVTVLLSLGVWLADRNGTSRADLARSDPDGARACQILDGWLTKHRAAPEFEVSKQAGYYAAIAKTPTIRAAVNGIADVHNSGDPDYVFEGYSIVDLHKLHDACSSAGVDLPPYP